MLMRLPRVHVSPKHLLTLGTVVEEGGVVFVAYSHQATAMRVLLYDAPQDREPVEVIEMPRPQRMGDLGRVRCGASAPDSCITCSATDHGIPNAECGSTAAPG